MINNRKIKRALCVYNNYKTVNTAEKVVDSLIYRKDLFSFVFSWTSVLSFSILKQHKIKAVEQIMQQFKTVSASVKSVYPISAITHPRQDRIQCSAYPYHLNMRMLAKESFYFPILHILIENIPDRKHSLGSSKTITKYLQIRRKTRNVLILIQTGSLNVERKLGDK